MGAGDEKQKLPAVVDTDTEDLAAAGAEDTDQASAASELDVDSKCRIEVQFFSAADGRPLHFEHPPDSALVSKVVG